MLKRLFHISPIENMESIKEKGLLLNEYGALFLFEESDFEYYKFGTFKVSELIACNQLGLKDYIVVEVEVEIDIDDFANSWYLNINDSDCKYYIELGRRPKEYNQNIKTDYIYVSSSNNIEAPNDRILFNDEQGMVYFRNVKTNFTTAKQLTSLSFISNMGRVYNIYDLYKKIYADEELDEINNPSSSFFK